MEYLKKFPGCKLFTECQSKLSVMEPLIEIRARIAELGYAKKDKR